LETFDKRRRRRRRKRRKELAQNKKEQSKSDISKPFGNVFEGRAILFVHFDAILDDAIEIRRWSPLKE